MKILVTGVAGFIGSHLAARLGARGDALVGLDNFDETLYPAALHRRNLALVADRVEFHEGDFLDAELIDRLFANSRFDVVVHLGALAGVRPSLQQPKRYQRVNVEGTLDLLEACRAHGVRRFVFASSSSVYGARNEVPFREHDPAVRPASPYAASKRAGELFCSTYSDLFGIATTALRFFTVYGPRQRPEMAIHKFARLIADGKPVPFYGDGSTARDYTFVDDIIDGVVAAIDHCDGGVHRVYNLGGSRTTTLAQLVELLEAGMGKKAILDRQPDQPGDVPITYADVTHAAAELGYAPKVPIEDGIARFCAWLKEQKYMSVADVELLEKSRITVEDDGKAFRIRGVVIPFDAILHIELTQQTHKGQTEVAAWREQRAVARIITDDRLHDPVLMEMGVRASSSDGEPPDFDATLLSVRVRKIAEAAARVSGKRVLQR